MQALTGYADKMSVAPGETIRFMVSAEQNQAYKARLVRVICGDSNPQGPGLKFEPVSSLVDGEYQGQRQTTDAGSYMVAENLPALALDGGLSFGVMIWPTLLERPDQTIMALWDSQAMCGVRLTLLKGALALIVTNASGQAESVLLGALVLCRRWYLVRFSIDATGQVFLAQKAMDPCPFSAETAGRQERLSISPPFLPRSIYLAGCPGRSKNIESHYNGKLDGPTVWSGVVDDAFVIAHRMQALSGVDSSRALLQWDFSHDMSGAAVRDCGPYRCNGRLVHLPARAMKGWNWKGDRYDWRVRPEQYGAIHFHEDDLYDANWATSHELRLPDDLKSGAYALHLSCGDNDEDLTRVDYIPFFVRPPRAHAHTSTSRPKLAFLAPTCSYLAYANESQALVISELELGLGRLPVLQHADVFLHAHPEYGLSLYDKHADGSGVCYSSRLRPILNFRPNHFSWVGGYGSGLWQYNADTHLFDWLNAKGFDYDILTDEDLHHEGYKCIADYEVIITGTHPEYYSTPMLHGLNDYLDRGGSLMYLGGDGFYWRVAFSDKLPGVIEVRRAEDGIRTWEAEPGEYHHNFTGELGGLWRRVGRAPNLLCGVGFVAQGFDVSSYYRRGPDSWNPRASFIFEGVPDKIVGDFGLIGGGAAGLELDGINYALGSPLNVLRLASSEKHSSMVMLVNEEFNVVPPNLGGDQNSRVRADLAFFETPAGGGVFSTGSIAWCGSLSHNSYDNNVSRITENVLRRFLAPEPFDFPNAPARS